MAAAPSPQPQQVSAQQQYQQSQVYPESHHLMPSSLKRIPNWYQNGPFRYNLRFIIGLLPGALLLFTVTGRRMMAFVSLGGIGTMLVRGSEIPYLSMYLTVGHLLVLEMINIWNMVPIVWQSVLNIPLFVVFHSFIVVAGVWWCLQDEEFKKQDPRFVILAEKILFSIAPVATVATVTWVGGMLFGRYAIPIIILLAGVLSFSLYLVPLQSSLARPQTPTDIGLIQHSAVVCTYLVLQMALPPLTYLLFNYSTTFSSLLGLLVIVTANPFLLSLLEPQGLFQWVGVHSIAAKTLRWISGTALVILLSLLLLTQHSSATYLPLLLVPTLFTQLDLISSAVPSDNTHVATPTLLLGAALGLLYSLAFFLLPWSISHNFSFLSLPLSIVQLLLWGLAMATVVIATFWQRSTLQYLIIYNTVFVFCEYLLSWDEVYPVSVAMVTATTATVMFWRLHSIKQLSTNSAVLSVSLHLTKLSLLLPSHPHTLTTSTLVTTLAIIMVSYSLLRVLLFEPATPISQLLVYSGLLSIGLVLSIETLLTPLWTAVTHGEPSGASVGATILAIVGVFLLVGQRMGGDRGAPPSLLTLLPHGLFTIAVLIGVLQPEFNLGELIESFLIAAGDASVHPEEMYLAAWTNLLTWVMLYTAVFTLVLLLYLRPFTIVATSFLGLLAGFLLAISLAHHPPATALGMLYGTLLAMGGALLGRTVIASKDSHSFLDSVLFVILLLIFFFLYWTEWNSLPRQHLPWKPVLDYYALPSTQVFSFLTLSLAVAFRVKMHMIGGQSFLPIIGNLCCLLFFLFATFHPLLQQLEVSILLTSCVFLLAQPDGVMIPRASTIFLAPSLVMAVTLLYLISGTSIASRITSYVKYDQSLLVVLRVVEIVCLLATVPGQGLFLHHLWTGRPLNLTPLFTLLYIAPSAVLPQFSSSVASSALGGIGVLSFCLLALTPHANVQLF